MDDNDEPKNCLPGLVTPGDSGFEYSSDSDSEGEPLAIRLGKENVSYEGTAEFKEYADKTNNAPGSTKVEDAELRCPKLSTGENCLAHRSEEDMKFVSYMCPLIATPEHCINPEYSAIYHGKKNSGRVVNFLRRLRHKETEETK